MIVVATIDDVARLASALPEVVDGEYHGTRAWFVRGKVFARVRPFSKADVRRYGDETPPDGDIIAIPTADLAEKEAILPTHEAFFTIPHLDGYPTILVWLNRIDEKTLGEAIVDGWLACAPAELADAYVNR